MFDTKYPQLLMLRSNKQPQLHMPNTKHLQQPMLHFHIQHPQLPMLKHKNHQLSMPLLKHP